MLSVVEFCVKQGCKCSERLVARETAFFTVAPNIFSVVIALFLLHVRMCIEFICIEQ
jgi:hypothetical protein